MKGWNLGVVKFGVAFNSAAAGWYATMTSPRWAPAAGHIVCALYGAWVLWKTRKD